MQLHGIKLTCNDWRAEILPHCGANLIFLEKSGSSFLRTPKSMEAFWQAPMLYGNPLLFPPNRIKDGRFCFQGTEYHLPINEEKLHNHIHGLIHTAHFEVKAVTEHSASCSLSNKGEWFPFPFVMNVLFDLACNGLMQSIEIINTGCMPMPVLLGLHTSFFSPDSFAVPIGKRWNTDERYIPTGELCGLTEQELMYKNGCRPEGQKISGFYTADGHIARIGNLLYQSSPEFSQWILFNQGGDQGLLCVEPQSDCVNGLNMPNHYITLPAGESVQFWVRFTT